MEDMSKGVVMSLRGSRKRWSTSIAAMALGFCFVMPTTASLADSYAVEADDSLSFAQLDIDKLMAQESNRAQSWDPPQFAVPTRVNLTPGTTGTKERLGNGAVVWRLRLTCENAKSFNLGTRFQVGDSVTVSLLDADGRQHDRSYTSADNKPHGEFWSPIIHGNAIEIEATMRPTDWADFMQDFAVISVNIGFRNVGSAIGLDRSGTCHNDIVCPEANGWEGAIESVGWYTLNGSGVCSGFMINNTNQDQTPLFMTANHCGVSTGNDSSMRVYWNYEHSVCRDDSGSSNNGPPGNGSLSQSQTGATRLAASNSSDYCLVLLDDSPNSAWGVTFAGWDSRDTASPNGAGVHHPNLDEKRISFYNSSTQNIGSGLVQVFWSDGVTEGGSSGSPLFDNNKRVIGQLCCGSSFCSQQNQPDQYGRFDETFAGSSTIRQYLCGGCAANSDAFIDTLVPGGNPDPTGSCCVGSTCSVTTAANCSGTWTNGGNCSSNPCGGTDPLGACCSGSSCSETTQSNCAGTWINGGDCSASPCGGGECPPGFTADCQGTCFPDGVYTDWQGDTFCDDGSYIPADYCDYPSYDCADCPAGVAIFLNCEDFVCDSGDCTGCGGDPSGACCTSTTECSVTTEANCAGTWTAGATCSVSLCGGDGEFESYVIDLAGVNSWDNLNDVDNETFAVDLGVDAQVAGVAWSGCNVSTVAAGSWASDTGFYFADSSLTEETAVIAYPFAGQEGTSDEADLTAYLSDSGIDNITSTDGIFYVEVFEFSDANSNYDEAPNAVDNIINTGTLTILYVPGDTPQPVCGNGVVEDGEECDDGNNTPNDGCTNCTNDPEPPCAGDFDDDGSVGLSDFSSFLVAFGTTCSGCVEDIDGSGAVDLADFSAFLVVFGTDCP